MNIKSVYIKNFRGITEFSASLKLTNFNVLIDDNGTEKTTILEAINLCLSPGYAASRLDINDFHKGTEESFEVTLEFSENFTARLHDGFAKQDVVCNKISLVAKKRERGSSGKAFSDLVTTAHYVVPVAFRGEKGWSQQRKTSEKPFEFTEHHLALSNIEVSLPRIFYFSKSRNRQLAKGYNSSFSTIIDDLNWRFEKGQRGVSEEDHFKHARKEFHQKITTLTDGDTLKKTIDAANEILKTFEVDVVDLSLCKTLSPYDHSELVFPFEGFELPVEQGGSGIEMIISLALLEAMAKVSKENIR